MPTFVAGSGVGDNYATFLLPVPDVDWFKAAVMGALNEMTYEYNWIEMGDVAVSFAVEESARMLKDFKLTNFNPFPVGMIFPYGGATAPDGYKLCDGSSLVVDDYPELFSAIGYIWGGSGTDFNTPDFRDRVGVGAGSSFAVADFGGNATITLTTAEMPSHDHAASAPSVTDLGHTHTEISAIPTAITIGAGIPAPSALPSVSVTGLGFTGISVSAPVISPTGGDGAHDNMQPYNAINYIIYAGRL
jgi:microcystin-dependent protein